MACYDVRGHRLKLLPLIMIVSIVLFSLMHATRLTHADLTVPDEAVARGIDLDQHEHTAGAVEAMTPHRQHTGPHMRWTTLRNATAGDADRADQIVQALRQALAKYKDYRTAMNDGYISLHPERTPKHYHFANKERRLLARTHFDPGEPTALLYRKAGNGYELEGAMYTAPRGMSEDQLHDRIPLSVAQWHAHVNLCLQPEGSRRRISRRQFGFKGTIATESECQQAGGRFVPQAGGWMIHVYPFEATPAKIWTH
jgi:hypothetical protein